MPTLRGGFGNDTLEGDLSPSAIAVGDVSDALAGVNIIDKWNVQNSIPFQPGGDAGLGNDAWWDIRGVLGSNFDDTIAGSPFLAQDTNWWFNGGAGNDSLTGGTFDDTLIGGSGSDRLFGLGGNDSLLGGDGNDSIVGGAGFDTLIGGSGNDVMSAGNTAPSGTSHDLYLYTAASIGTGDVVSGGNDTIAGGTNEFVDFNGLHGALKIGGSTLTTLTTATTNAAVGNAINANNNIAFLNTGTAAADHLLIIDSNNNGTLDANDFRIHLGASVNAVTYVATLGQFDFN